MSDAKRRGWHWPAFFLGPIWYINKGMTRKGVWMLVLCFESALTAVPFLLLYSGIRARSDLFEHKLRMNVSLDINRLKQRR